MASRSALILITIVSTVAIAGGIAYVALQQQPGLGSSTTSSRTATSSSGTFTSSSQGAAAVFLSQPLPASIFVSPGTRENYSVVRIVPLGGDLSKPVLLTIFTPQGFSASISSQSVSLASGEQRVGLTIDANPSVQAGKYQLNLQTTSGGVSKNTSFSLVVVTRVVFLLGANFTPANITVSQGSTVGWVNLDGPLSGYDPGTHNVVFVGGPASPSMSQYDTFMRTFTSPGTYKYTCTYHPGMDGIVIVAGG